MIGESQTRMTVARLSFLVTATTASWFFGVLAARIEQSRMRTEASTQESVDESSQAPLLDSVPVTALPARVTVHTEKARLGSALYHDRNLSRDRSVSCASCHPLDRAGVDGEAHSFGSAQRPTAVNTPTVFNCGFNLRYNWNGAYLSLAAELDAPIQRAMGMTWALVVERVRADAQYVQKFGAVYPDGITEANIRDAIVEFERGLITPGSRFDRYLAGEMGALTAEEAEGWRLFREFGCSSCHQGTNIGGNMFQRMGVMGDYFTDRGGESRGDQGLAAATGNATDRHVFRVPSLRNVERTAPYLHDGTARTLEAAIDTMARYQLGRSLTRDEVSKIAAFLRTLTGAYQGQPL